LPDSIIQNQYRINPAFHRHQKEAAIIGRLSVAFSELEYIMCATAGRATNNLHPTLKALYRMRAIGARIGAADAFMRPAFQQIGKQGEYGVMLGAIKYCLSIRNQYGHCNWGDHEGYPGLFFANLEETAAAADGWELRWFHVDVPILEQQEAYFVYTQSWLYHLEGQLSLTFGRQVYPLHPEPLPLERPPLHNPPLQHIPPWLSQVERDRHIVRAEEAEAQRRKQLQKQNPAPGPGTLDATPGR
jgi:hypothetical protein